MSYQRRRQTRKRRGGAFKFPKFKKPSFGKLKEMKKKTMKKMGSIKDKTKHGFQKVKKKTMKKMGSIKDKTKHGFQKVKDMGKAGMTKTVRKLGPKMAMGAAGLGGMGALGLLASSLGGIPPEKFRHFAKIGGMAIAPLMLLGSFLKPGARFIYQGLKSVITLAVYRGKDGLKFLINLGGIPVKGLTMIIGNLPTMMMAMGGFAGVAALVGKNYLTWIWQTWKYIANGWKSMPLLTWCEKQDDGTCRCPQTLKIVKKDGKPGIIVEDVKKAPVVGATATGGTLVAPAPTTAAAHGATAGQGAAVYIGGARKPILKIILRAATTKKGIFMH